MSAGDKFTKDTTAQEVAETFGDRIKGRYVVVTGTSPGGLGYETARAIATQGPKLLVLAARDQAKLDAAKADILKETPSANIATVILDLDSQAQVRKAAADIAALGDPDVLINNAAIMMNPYGKTSDGLESQFGTNYVGPWLLTALLLPSILKTPSPRVVVVSSAGHRSSDIRWDDLGFSEGKEYEKRAAYGQSKTGNILHALALSEKYGDKGLVAVSLHPGVIMTNLSRHLTQEDFSAFSAFWNEDGSPKPGLFKSIPQGAATTVTAAFDPRWEKHNGVYLVDSQIAPDLPTTGGEDLLVGGMGYILPYAKDKKAALRLWDLTNKITGENF
ncbi:short-chain dehydrogenase TIC 32 [Vanrija pseudolonga]|uniref:Short-chain dehydrogenase TIC 32, chloroplastic n=1 Tax=Vanrija pseudolonga TaxID=143232 RepID=A0AAF0YF93_9TREE|nr:Short-chain dehydrogenase TIC 32, chloroplastic [Vanrija pseudolonga]